MDDTQRIQELFRFLDKLSRNLASQQELLKLIASTTHDEKTSRQLNSVMRSKKMDLHEIKEFLDKEKKD